MPISFSVSESYSLHFKFRIEKNLGFEKRMPLLFLRVPYCKELEITVVLLEAVDIESVLTLNTNSKYSVLNCRFISLLRMWNLEYTFKYFVLRLSLFAFLIIILQ